MFTPPSGLNIIWLIKFDNRKLKYLQSVKAQLSPLHQMGPFPPPKAFGRSTCICGKTLKGGRFAVLTRKGAKSPQLDSCFEVVYGQ
jgi:hypothetical protein